MSRKIPKIDCEYFYDKAPPPRPKKVVVTHQTRLFTPHCDENGNVTVRFKEMSVRSSEKYQHLMVRQIVLSLSDVEKHLQIKLGKLSPKKAFAEGLMRIPSTISRGDLERTFKHMCSLKGRYIKLAAQGPAARHRKIL